MGIPSPSLLSNEHKAENASDFMRITAGQQQLHLLTATRLCIRELSPLVLT